MTSTCACIILKMWISPLCIVLEEIHSMSCFHLLFCICREVEAHVKDLEEVCRTSGSPTDGATSPSPSELQRQEGNSFDI